MLLTENEMLVRWALRHHVADIRHDAGITRPEGSPDAEIMLVEMRAWYFNLLMTADPSVLHVYELCNAVVLNPTPTTGLYDIELPEEFLRLVGLEVETSAGRRNVRVVDPDSRIGILQNNPRTMAGPCSPVAYAPQPGSNALHLFVNDKRQPRIKSFRAITVPPEGSYAITEAALALMPSD